jgi:DNA polymerase III sliding clamp (beta) subunit (PCNA family)
MDATVPLDRLRAAINFVTPTPDVSNDIIELNATGKRLSITLPDPEAEISSAITAQVHAPGTVHIHSRTLNRFLNTLGQNTEITLSTVNDVFPYLTLTIKNLGTYHFNLSTSPPPPLSTGPFSDTIPSVPISGLEDLPWLSFLEAAHDESIGACIVMEDSVLYLITTNLFVVNALILKQKSSFEDFTLPINFAHLKKLFILEPASVRFDYDRHYYRFKTTQAALSLRPAFNEFPDVIEVLKKQLTPKLPLNRVQLVSAMERLSIASPIASIFLSTKGSQAILSDSPQTKLINWENIDTLTPTAPSGLEVEFNPRYIYKTLADAPASRVSIHYETSPSLLYFQCPIADGAQALSVIMAQSITIPPQPDPSPKA